MSFYRPAEIGMTLSEVDTPALILDLGAFERNLDRMDASLAGKKIKCPTCGTAVVVPPV